MSEHSENTQETKGKSDDGGPAFPIPRDGVFEHSEINGYGMSIRDYFAAKAMQGILAGDRISTAHGWGTEAATAYQIADAMLTARKEGRAS